MPAMIRTKESEKIMWQILPKPMNLTEKKTPKQVYIDSRINNAWLARQR